MDISEAISLSNKRKPDEYDQCSELDVIQATPQQILKKSRLAVILKAKNNAMAHIHQPNKAPDAVESVFVTDSDDMDELFKDIDIDFSEKFTKQVKLRITRIYYCR